MPGKKREQSVNHAHARRSSRLVAVAELELVKVPRSLFGCKNINKHPHGHFHVWTFYCQQTDLGIRDNFMDITARSHGTHTGNKLLPWKDLDIESYCITRLRKISTAGRAESPLRSILIPIATWQHGSSRFFPN